MSDPQWRPVVGYEDRYEVSDGGVVRSTMWIGTHTRHKLSDPRVIDSFPWPNGPDGYTSVVLCRDGTKRKFRVHVLVLTAFVGVRPAGMVARHLNGDKYDNRVENLAWGTPTENAMDKKRHGRQLFGAELYNAKLNEHDVRIIRAMREEGIGPSAIARVFGVSKTTIGQIGKTTWLWVA
jgi:hypothetical protein